MNEKVWIYNEDKKIFRQLAHSDPRLDWTWPHSPLGCVRMRVRKGFRYYYVGQTKEEAAARANFWRNREIADCRKKIAFLEDQMVRP